MKGLFIVLVLLVVGIAGFGFYRGWFSVATENADHKPTVSFSMDQDKFKEDEEKVKDKVHNLGHKAKDTTGDKTDKVQEKEQERQP